MITGANEHEIERWFPDPVCFACFTLHDFGRIVLQPSLCRWKPNLAAEEQISARTL